MDNNDADGNGFEDEKVLDDKSNVAVILYDDKVLYEKHRNMIDEWNQTTIRRYSILKNYTTNINI